MAVKKSALEKAFEKEPQKQINNFTTLLKSGDKDEALDFIYGRNLSVKDKENQQFNSEVKI